MVLNEEQRLAMGVRLADIRKKAKLTQKQFAERYSLSESTVSKVECGTCIPSLEILMDYAILAQCSIDFLVFGVLTPEERALSRRLKELSFSERYSAFRIYQVILEELRKH